VSSSCCCRRHAGSTFVRSTRGLHPGWISLGALASARCAQRGRARAQTGWTCASRRRTRRRGAACTPPPLPTVAPTRRPTVLTLPDAVDQHVRCPRRVRRASRGLSAEVGRGRHWDSVECPQALERLETSRRDPGVCACGRSGLGVHDASGVGRVGAEPGAADGWRVGGGSGGAYGHDQRLVPAGRCQHAAHHPGSVEEGKPRTPHPATASPR